MADSTTYAGRLQSEENLVEMLRGHRSIGVDFWAPQWAEFTKLQRFSNGIQWPDADATRMDSPQVRAPRLTFDRISQILQTFSGREMMQRLERTYIPRHPGAASEAEIMTLVDRAMMSACDAEQVVSEAFKDGPGIQGVSCVRWELDTLKERGGGLLLTSLPMWQMVIDPQSRRINFSDRAWHRYGSWWPQSEVKARWPDEYDEISAQSGSKTWAPTDNSFSSRIPWVGMAGNKPLEVYYPRGRSLWIEYEEWREVNTHWEVGQPVDPSMSYADSMAAAMQQPGADPNAPPPADPLTTVQMKTKREVNDFKEQHQATFGEEVPKDLIVKKDVLVYRYAYICGDTILETDEIPTGYWTIQFLTGFRFPQPDKVLFKSLVSRLIDPQKWINVFMSALIRNFQITPKGSLMVEEGFFKNRNEAMASWASPGGLIMVGRGKLTGGTPGYQQLSGGTQPYAQMVSDMLQVFKDALPEMAGFNPGAMGQLGSDLRRISGEVVRQVQDAAMTSNAEPFDSLRLCRREGGRIFLSFLRRFFEMEDIIRIVGEDVAYEQVMEPMTQPVMAPAPPDPTTGQAPVDPATGQPQMVPQTDHATGQPVMQPVLDPATRQPLMQPAIDPATGEPQRKLVIPDKSMWAMDAWKEVAIEDAEPTTDQLQLLWKSLETSMPMLLGQQFFTNEDLAEIIPNIPASRREKMIQRFKMMKTWQYQQQQMQQQAPPQQGQGAQQPPAGGGGQPPPQQAAA